MRRFLTKVRSERSVRRVERKNQEQLLKMATLMSHEYPQGTSPHYIASQMARNK